LELALKHLKPEGMIVFDNVERRRYRDAIANHYGKISIAWTTGLTPALPYPSQTALITWD
jgi:predicted O-methyltransferase YrrM